MKLLNLTISRVDLPVFDGEVVSVTVPGTAGEMTLLANHSAIISPLKEGTILIKKESGEDESVSITSGTLEMSDNHATILI
ncbi:hypothetical protein COU14_02545 [Candidatus Kaiserbacteria bacterium CG10_big_fil_rev_8_21_14_0_10_44_10]|uniref:ATP synthase F1 complex delta/epsilon subunit N-terminal domain-containing protein n=1 Tax=Candidatus Kaiserbacteria bacterium CG10_big_fil_rev_8_21_14_0_10_44_10 TaxID=1974606 RepID=A0A2H0UHA3_9BACT|nr:MAG: hypothetical protein COU14_02545 [Candidatus Kaiserbacteria bacterium CG10_big_fil_rev_8_21_14_0_10_44_10]